MSPQTLVLTRMKGLAPCYRPYDQDKHIDCYKYVRTVWNAILFDLNVHSEDYENCGIKNNITRWIPASTPPKSRFPFLPVADYSSSNANWEKIPGLDILVPGDVLATHQGHQWGDQWHGGLYYGKENNRHYIYDCTRGVDQVSGADKRPFNSGFQYFYRPIHEMLTAAQIRVMYQGREIQSLYEVRGDTVYVAIRDFANEFGYGVEWNAQKRSVICYNNNRTVEIPSSNFTIDSTDDHAWGAIRVIAGYLNLGVEWDNENRIVRIY